jgi:hypothetical protein
MPVIAAICLAATKHADGIAAVGANNYSPNHTQRMCDARPKGKQKEN